MTKVPNTQDFLRLTIPYNSFDDEEEIDSVTMKYINPSGESGEFEAQHNTDDRKVYYDLPLGSPLAKLGKWKLWIGFTMTDGRYMAQEEPCILEIVREGF